MLYKEGDAGGPGRPKGSKNKFTEFKDLIYEALENRREEVLKMDLRKLVDAGVNMMPKEQKLEVTQSEPIQVEITILPENKIIEDTSTANGEAATSTPDSGQS